MRTWGAERVRSVMLALGLAVVLGCSAPGGAPAPGTPAKPGGAPTTAAAPGTAAQPAARRSFQLGVVALVTYMYPMWVAQERGFWAEQGLDVEITTFQTNEAVAALVSGSLDVLMCPTDGCVTAVSKGAQIRQVNDFLTEAPYDLIAKPEIGSVANLRGRKIGVSSLSTGSGTLAKIMLRARGLSPDDYELVQAGGNPQRFAALQAGGVDASLLSDPVNFAALQEGYLSLLNFTEVVPQYSFTSNWVQNSWLETPANRDYLVAFQVGQIKAKQWAHDPANKAALIDMLVAHTNTTPAIAERVYNFYAVQNPNIVGVDNLIDEPTRAVVNILTEWENLPPLPPESQWRDPSFIQRARQRAGL
jgi:ABC-type nitrate/sulfonate/bicarbonate transport system substrate-binding protein